MPKESPSGGFPAWTHGLRSPMSSSNSITCIVWESWTNSCFRTVAHSTGRDGQQLIEVSPLDPSPARAGAASLATPYFFTSLPKARRSLPEPRAASETFPR